MKKLYLALTLLISSSALHAALPPVYQSIREYEALFASLKLPEILGSAEPIESVTRNKEGFVVKTNKHSLVVDVIYETMDQPGPAKFHLGFHHLESLDQL